MITSLRMRMNLLFAAFFLLIFISVVATVWAIDTQKEDALVINLAGRQRMLIQQMTKDALEIEKGRGKDHIPSLQEAARTFDQTLWAFISGGQAPYLPDRTVEVPATRPPHILAGLHQVHQTWDTFRGYLDVIIATDPASPDFKAAIQAVEHLSPALVQKADDVVRMYEAASTQKTARLRWIQVAFFIGALALLAVGSVMTQKSVVSPLGELGSAAERIGRGDLNTPVELTGPREIELLARTLDTMRAQLRASQEELIAWTEELEARVAQRTQELAALYEVSRDISAHLDLNHVLESVTDKARLLLGGEVAALCLLDEKDHALNLGAASGPPEALRGTRVPAQSSLASQVLAGNRALPCGVDGCVGSCDILAARFGVSHLAAPLRIRDHLIGALCVGSPKANAFSDEAVILLTKLANSAAIALENARLYQQAERVATLEERQRIAADMHDGLAQTLSYLSLKIEQVTGLVEVGRGQKAMDELRYVQNAIAQASQEVRQSIAHLQEGPQPRQALQDRLAQAVAEWSGGSGRPVDLVIKLPAPLLLSPGETEQVLRVTRNTCSVSPGETEQVLRVTREALLNAWRHARAEHIVVCLEKHGDEAVVIVEDDGRGFDPQAPLTDGEGHFGLSIMRARAARIGGRVTIHSAPGQGTRVVLAWPLAHSLECG